MIYLYEYNPSGLSYVSENTINKTLNFDINDNSGVIDNKINGVSKL